MAARWVTEPVERGGSAISRRRYARVGATKLTHLRVPVFCCNQLSKERGMLTTRRAFRSLCRAGERNQCATFDIRLRRAGLDIGSCLRKHRSTVSVQDFARN